MVKTRSGTSCDSTPVQKKCYFCRKTFPPRSMGRHLDNCYAEVVEHYSGSEHSLCFPKFGEEVGCKMNSFFLKHLPEFCPENFGLINLILRAKFCKRLEEDDIYHHKAYYYVKYMDKINSKEVSCEYFIKKRQAEIVFGNHFGYYTEHGRAVLKKFKPRTVKASDGFRLQVDYCLYRRVYGQKFNDVLVEGPEKNNKRLCFEKILHKKFVPGNPNPRTVKKLMNQDNAERDEE